MTGINMDWGETFTIRKMELDDVERVLPIASTSLTNPWSKKMFLGELSHPYSHCFLVCQNIEDIEKKLIGFLCFRILGEESELLNICIHPQYRQKGLGKWMMEFYLHFSYQHGVKKHYLEVDPLNRAAVHLYQSLGFHQVGLRKNFYQGRWDALVMERVV